jgi:hypothetical protein
MYEKGDEMKHIQKIAMYLVLSGTGMIYADAQKNIVKVSNKSAFYVSAYVANRNTNNSDTMYCFNNVEDGTKTKRLKGDKEILKYQQDTKMSVGIDGNGTPYNVVANINYDQDPRGVTVVFFDGDTLVQTISVPVARKQMDSNLTIEIMVEGSRDGSVAKSVALWNNAQLKQVLPAGIGTTDAAIAAAAARDDFKGSNLDVATLSNSSNVLTMYFDAGVVYKAGP